jgi:hypothetical protein
MKRILLAASGLLCLLSSGCGNDSGNGPGMESLDVAKETSVPADVADTSVEPDGTNTDPDLTDEVLGDIPADMLDDMVEPVDLIGDEGNPDLPPDITDPDVTIEDVEPDEVIPIGPCSHDEDCMAGYCNTLTTECVECLWEHHCGEKEHCILSSCVLFSACESDDVCDPGLCHPESGECVECLLNEQCNEDELCEGNVCVQVEPCESSKDCETGICWLEVGKCVDCLEDVDCDEGQLCKETICITLTGCQSDKECTPDGLVCNKELGHCVQCVGDEDCPLIFHCAAGECLLDFCDPTLFTCQDNGIYGCSEAGDAVVLLEPCSEQQTCVEAGPETACLDWVCTPGPAYCHEETSHAISCSVDGLAVVQDTDCTADELVCDGGVCLPVVCEPGTVLCNEELSGLENCSEKGTVLLQSSCPEGTYCAPGGEESPATCEQQLCIPGTPVCDGDTATTCNNIGSAYHPDGISCDALDMTCINGECFECQATEVCDGVDNNCNDQVDENPVDCQGSGKQCFFGTCYSTINYNCWVKKLSGHVYQACYISGTNFTEAAQFCASWHGSHLVVLNNQDEEQFILANISGPGAIGYSDVAQEETWVWAVGSSNYSNWCPNQPDNWQNNEHCATMMNSIGGGQNCWNDLPCSDDINRFICEIDVP